MGLTKKILKNEISHFNPYKYVKNKVSGTQISKPPVFIVGCGHSGTTMLRHVLGMHPNIYAVPYESRVFFHSDLKVNIANNIWSIASVTNGKPRWLEKTPSHIHCLEKLYRFYPDSKVILLIRDGRDVAVSLNKRWGDFSRSVRRWVEDNRAGQNYWEHPKIKKILYEQLTTDYENQIKEICAFINEPFHSVLLEFARARTIKQQDDLETDLVKPREFRGKQIEKGLYNARGRWVVEMTPVQKGLFKQMAGEMLIEYGYAKDLDW